MGKYDPEKTTSILEISEELPAFDPIRPEKSLLVAILTNAIEDLTKAGPDGRRARTYFLSDDERYIFSFESVCNHLDIDPKKLRKKLGVL